MAADDELIAALLRERDGYLLYGRKDRAEQVTEQLRLLGWKPPRSSPPKGRSTRRLQKT